MPVGDRGRAASDARPADRPLEKGLGVVPVDGRVTRVHDPDRAAALGDGRRPRAGVGPLQPTAAGVDPAERRVAEDGPRGAGAVGDRPRRAQPGLGDLEERWTPPSSGSMRDTCPVSPCAIQTASSPYATPVGVAPRVNVLATVREPGSTRCSVLSSSVPTQTAPPPTATGPGPTPTGTTPVTRSEPGSITATEFGGAVIAGVARPGGARRRRRSPRRQAPREPQPRAHRRLAPRRLPGRYRWRRPRRVE